MRRIYFLVPDLKTASTVTDELLLARIEERHIHVIAREGTELGNLPKASLLQTSDVIPAVERGLAVGGVTGILAGVAAVTFPPAGMVLGGGAILATALAGSGIGAFEHDRRRCHEQPDPTVRRGRQAGRNPVPGRRSKGTRRTDRDDGEIASSGCRHRRYRTAYPCIPLITIRRGHDKALLVFGRPRMWRALTGGFGR